MTNTCPCGRTCTNCIYGNLCGGCLDESCVHIQTGKRETVSLDTKCLFCTKKGISPSCSHLNLKPPKKFECASPWLLEDTIYKWNEYRTGYADQPTQPKWPLLIPEVSPITETTSRLAVTSEEGNWRFHRWNPIAWDMTGYLLDEVQGAPWIPESDRSDDIWRSILGSEYNWIEDILLIDRLPDYLALQTPPSAIIAEYLNRLHACQWSLIAYDDAPSPWLLTHGYPSYIDWPPAWHWNLGIRMLASLAEYVGAATSGMMGAPKGAWYPDKSAKTRGRTQAPFIHAKGESRLIFPPHAEMDWLEFPGIIPFVPGADTTQLSWFAGQITGMGYEVLALDALNSISHENFRGLPEAINCLKRAGAKHVIVYGPWPLHPPSKYVPTHDVSYIPSAHHMDMTDISARFWRKRTKHDEESRKWEKIPNYRTTSLKEVNSCSNLEICACPPCKAATSREEDPRSVWRWGHLLQAGLIWQKRSKPEKRDKSPESDEESNLWYQGPSFTAFRKCLCKFNEILQPCSKHLYDAIVIDEVSMTVQYPDGFREPSEYIRWTLSEEGADWRDDFPKLEE